MKSTMHAIRLSKLDYNSATAVWTALTSETSLKHTKVTANRQIQVEIRSELRSLHYERLLFYHSNDIFNVEECGLFYLLPPIITVRPARLRAKKKRKERITFQFCTNSDVTEKLKPLVIGSAKNPSCFREATAENLGFDYQSSRKSWINKEIFFDWLKRFEQYIAKSEGRIVALVMDNASCHRFSESLPKLQHIDQVFLPKNSIFRIQPRDLGIIASVNADIVENK